MLVGRLSREANTSVSPNSLYIPINVFPFAERLHLSPSRKQQQFFKSYFQTKLLGGRLCAWRGRGTNGLRHTYFCTLNTRPECTGTRARARVCPTRSRSPRYTPASEDHEFSPHLCFLFRSDKFESWHRRLPAVRP